MNLKRIYKGKVSMSIFLLLLSLQISGFQPLFSQESQDPRISFRVNEATLEEIFNQLENSTGYNFKYADQIAGDSRLFSYDFTDRPLSEILNGIAINAGLEYKIDGDNISIKQLRKIEVRGKITDASSGDPLLGVTVSVRGTSDGTISNQDGEYTIMAYPNSVLSFSYVGYENMNEQVGSRNRIDIGMLAGATGLDEVVVIGYGTQKTSDITGSISSVQQKRLEQVPNLNVAQVVQGAMPGVIVTQTGAGAASTESILIRGRNSILASNNPLIIVDKIPYNGQLRDLNINDIESIEVLKDASATAIYGARGSNGVILITSKGGQSGKTTVSYDGRYGFQEYDVLPNYMNGEEFYQFKEIREPGNVTVTEQQNYDNGNFAGWQDLAVRSGNSQQHNLSISGGTGNVSYFVGGSYLDVKGVTLNDDYQRATGRINLDVKIADWISVATRTLYTNDDRSGIGMDLSDFGRKNPLINPYDENGEITIYPWPEFTDIGNPLEPLNYQNEDVSQQIISNNTLTIDFPFVEGLSYVLNTGISRRFEDFNTYRGRNTKAGLEANGSADVQKTEISSNTVENILDFSRDFGDHTIGFTGLYSYQ